MSSYGRFFRRNIFRVLLLAIGLNAVFAALSLAQATRSPFFLLHPIFSSIDPAHAALSIPTESRGHSGLLQRFRTLAPDKANESIAIYFMELNSGTWVGLNESVRMPPGSLRKIPLLAATFKLLELDQLRLTDSLEIRRHHLDLTLGIENAVGPLAAGGPGQEHSIRELVDYITRHSDNTATMALSERVGYEAYAEALFSMGLSLQTWENNFLSGRMTDYPVSPREFAQAFRTLYFSSYLKPEHSQELLALLSDTVFLDGIPAGVPPEIITSHKIGDWRQGDHHNDCGIVYYPAHPYLLCVMTGGMEKSQAYRLIADISRESFAYINEEFRLLAPEH
ncbi:MAG: serine hydrolase [Sulfuritalea sp.]|nr:serine hydrolase [Sulfuritalea sp.]